MTTLQWDQLGTRRYETGVDRGVLYLEDGTGIPWNGLTSVDEKVTGMSATPLYWEGVKYDEIITIGDFAASLKAYTYPDEFLEYMGIVETDVGLYVDNQPTKLFGLSYRTIIGNDLSATAGHKINILCNLSAIPSTKGYNTLSQNANMLEFEWSISSIPDRIPGFRSTAHLIFDTTKSTPEMIETIEGILYGDDASDAHLPTFAELVALATASVEV